MTADRRRFKGTCKTRHEVILAYLWEEQRWVAAPELIKLVLPYGITGSSGDVRARELARGECPERLKGKVERAEGRDIGLDKRFAYYRYREGTSHEDHLRIAREACEAFDNYQPHGPGTFRERQHCAENGHSFSGQNERKTDPPMSL